MKDQEIEVKFYVTHLARLENRLQELGAALVQPRVFERNLRFDTSAGDLAREYQVLRLRQDQQARLTFKGPAYDDGGARRRLEIEFTVSDFDAAWALLTALGYEVSMGYEKYRAVYDLHQAHVTLDELPYGHFVEIEGPDAQTIHLVAGVLGLGWERRIQASYVMLFDNLRQRLDLSFKDLSFANFKHLAISPELLEVLPAD